DRPLSTWIDDGQRVAVHVIDVQELEIPVRRDVLWQAANSEAADDPEGGRINDDHVAGSLIGNVDPRREPCVRGREVPAGGGLVDAGAATRFDGAFAWGCRRRSRRRTVSSGADGR